MTDPPGNRVAVDALAKLDSNPQHGQLQSIQVLRGLAAAAVLASHMGLELTNFHFRVPLAVERGLDVGRCGVDIFFVISGFVMVYVSQACFGSFQSSRRFITKRLIRIVPAYWFYTTAMLAVSVLAPRALRHGDFSLRYLAASYFFFPYPRPSTHDVTPLLELGWTLNYEMYFYALFAICMLFRQRTGLAMLVALIAGGVAIGSLVDFSSLPALWFWSRPIVLEFLVGALVALLYVNGCRLPQPVAVGMLLFALAWFLIWSAVSGSDSRLWRFGIPATLTVSACALIRRAGHGHAHAPLWSFLLLVGNASYSLYLSHMFVVRLATRLIDPKLFGSFFVAVYCVVVIAGVLALSIGSYRYVELPSKAFLEQMLALALAPSRRAKRISISASQRM